MPYDKDKPQFAVIGMGFIYSRHKEAIEAIGGQIHCHCDIDSDKFPRDAKKIKGYPDYSVVEYWTDWVEMMNHTRFNLIDYVIVCTPNYLHDVMVREALIRGKKVLCEKPLSINGIKGMDGAKVVMQLRYHPELKNLPKPKHLYVEAKMFRDQKYWRSWKGTDSLSGGILYNLGVHYIDLGIFLLGDKWEIQSVQTINDKKVHAVVNFGESQAEFLIEIVDKPELQGRKMIADGKEITLSNQENLSYEDLHKEVYRDFIQDKGIEVSEAAKSLDLIKAILNSANNGGA